MDFFNNIFDGWLDVVLWGSIGAIVSAILAYYFNQSGRSRKSGLLNQLFDFKAQNTWIAVIGGVLAGLIYSLYFRDNNAANMSDM